MKQHEFIIGIFALRYAIHNNSDLCRWIYPYFHEHLENINEGQKQQLKEEIAHILDNVLYNKYLSDLLKEL